MKRLLVLILICILTVPALCNSEDFYENQLDSGIRNSDEYSYLLIRNAHANSSEEINLLKKAVLYSPDLPAVYFELSKARFSLSYSGILDSIDYIVQGFNAYSRNFWWSFTLTGSLFFSLILSFILSITIIILIRIISDISLISHDIRENISMALPLLILLILSIFSPFLFLACLLILLGIYMNKIDRIVVYLFLIFLIFSPLIFRASSLFINTSSSGSIKSIVRVNESKGNNYAISVLKDNNDYNALFSYALAIKRQGYYYEAIDIYNRLIEHRSDPKIYINLANCYVGLNMLEEAAKNYLMAIDIKPLASAYYNLSQVSREMFDFEKGDKYFMSAISLDREAVSRYRTIYGRNPNRLVVDEMLDLADLWEYAIEQSNNVSTFGTTIIPSLFISFISLSLLFSFYQLNKRLKVKAFRCRKCNTILCSKCEKHLMWGQMCSRCFRSLIKISELEVKERVARLLSIYEHQKKSRGMIKILSFILPGLSFIYAGKILYGFIFLWPFLFFLFTPFTNSIFTGDSLLLSHGFIEWTAILIALVLYYVSNVITRLRISKGWL